MADPADQPQAPADPAYDLVPVDHAPEIVDPANGWSALPAPHGVPQITIGRSPSPPIEPAPYDLVPVDHVPQFADGPIPKAGKTIQPVAVGHDIAAMPGKVADTVGDLTGVTDAARALRGEMTPEEAQMFALGALPAMVAPEARAAKPAMTLAMDEASRMARAADLGFTTEAYHGTLSPQEFDAFRRRQNDIGIHFGTPGQADDRINYLASIDFASDKIAEPYSGNPRVLPVQLKLQNPLRLEDAGWWSPDNVAHELKKTGNFSHDEVKDALYSSYNDNPRTQLVALRKLIQSKGYDGIVYKNKGELEGAQSAREEVKDATDNYRKTFGLTGKELVDLVPANVDEVAARNRFLQASQGLRDLEANAKDSYVVFDPSQIRSRFAAFDPRKTKSGNILSSVAGASVVGEGLNRSSTTDDDAAEQKGFAGGGNVGHVQSTIAPLAQALDQAVPDFNPTEPDWRPSTNIEDVRDKPEWQRVIETVTRKPMFGGTDNPFGAANRAAGGRVNSRRLGQPHRLGSAAGSNPSIAKPALDGVDADLKFFGDLSRAQAIRIHGFDSLDRQVQHVVLSHVIAALHNEKIFNRIVKAVPIDVMDMLLGKKLSAEELLHNPAVLAHRLAIPSDVAIPKIVGRFIDALATVLKLAFAGTGTEKVALARPASPFSSEPGATIRADESGRLLHGHTILSRHSETHINPTEAQKKAGNYLKGSVPFSGMQIKIENPKGSIRSGIGRDGKPWACALPAHYGYLKQTEGADGDHVDIYLGPHPKAPHVFVIDQVDADSRAFDEHKAMLGFGSEQQALRCYRRAFSDARGGDRVGKVTGMTVARFREWLQHGDTKKPFAHVADRKDRVRDILQRHGVPA